MGSIAAQCIQEAREHGEFISKQDLKKRGKIGDATIALLDKFGCLEGMSETNQISRIKLLMSVAKDNLSL